MEGDEGNTLTGATLSLTFSLKDIGSMTVVTEASIRSGINDDSIKTRLLQHI